MTPLVAAVVVQGVKKELAALMPERLQADYEQMVTAHDGAPGQDRFVRSFFFVAVAHLQALFKEFADLGLVLPSPGRRYYSALSLAAIGCHSLGF